ncbi:alginate lyase family protein [Helicobacter pylori]|uniref:Alginate lyase family protein n=1 Tax=Helicobacter pylori TaxID=210 RepID=A0AAE7DTJ3_HELPX|nr:alginate lyase family protein [Helicobacter pylori]QJW29109.1 alginate lyase family protein [Helicobacter pylori A45]QJW40402.1 alginate lyase family protein [Helicobacter pylori]QJW41862.1 alginate lyase family protein [Helicobacter pylori]QJW43316.1 alginate lyase family protein [Helicobacter pylori]
MKRFVLFLLFMCVCVCVQAYAKQDYFFRDFKSIDLPKKLHLDKKLSQTIQPCMQLNASKHYTSTGVREPNICTKSFKKSATMSYDLALGYLVSKNKQYGLKAIEILNAWAKELQSVDTYQSEDNINFYMPYMNMAYWFVKKAIPSPEYEDFIKRMRQYSQSALNTNHGAWGILFDVSSALALDDHALLHNSANRWQEWVFKAIDENGVIASAITRSDTSDYHGGPTKGIKGIAYTNFALLALTVSGELLFENGYDLWGSEAGKRLSVAYNKVATWILNPETFPYFQPNLIGVHNNAYFIILAKHYSSPSANELLKQGDLHEDGFRLKLRSL